GVYVVQISLRLSGRLDTAAFLRAWQRVIERNAVLRTGFAWEGLEKPLQVVWRHAELEVRRESWAGLADLADLDIAGQQDRLADILRADRERGFDLGAAPLLRLGLFDLGEESWHLVWSHHHIVSDGWTQGLLLGELFTCYAAFVEKREPSLPRVRPYRDYIAWLQRQDLAEAEALWRRRLAGFEAPTLLAGAEGPIGAIGAIGAGVPGWWRGRLAAETSAALREAGRRHHLTLSTLVQGAWSLVLAQATGADDVVFGNTVAGRPLEIPGVESIFGLFINTLPVRVAFDPAFRLLPWLAELQERQAEARHYEHAPLHLVQQWSGLPSGTALFDHLLVFENQPLGAAVAGGLPGLAIAELTPREQTNYPLSVAVVPGPELALEVVYDSGRFDADIVTRLMERLLRVLGAFSMSTDESATNERLGELALLSESERHQILVEWGGAREVAVSEHRQPWQPSTLHSRFEAWARRAPGAVAATHEGASLSYVELNRRANQLAHRLRALGVGPEVLVGLCCERSLELLVGVLGIHKAGGAYVPLDPHYPRERLSYIIEDSGIEVVTGTAEPVSGLAGAAVTVLLDAESDLLASLPEGDQPPPPGLDGSNLA
ncbi:MAG TPA: condensation domain-containing protein, partial [Thermoanaerobaculia bacterium]